MKENNSNMLIMTAEEIIEKYGDGITQMGMKENNFKLTKVPKMTVKDLIEQLKKFDCDKEVQVGAVGFSSKDSWDAPLTLGNLTVDEHKGIVRINFPLYPCTTISTKNKENEEVYIDDIFDPQLKWTRDLIRQDRYRSERHKVRFGICLTEQDEIVVSTQVHPGSWVPIYFRRGDKEYSKLNAFLSRLKLIAE